MTIEEAKKLLPPELKYPLPDGTIDNLLEIQKIAIDMSEPDEKGMHYAMMAALIELKEIKEDDYRSGIAKAIYDKGYKSGWNSCINDKADGWMVDYI